MPTTTTRRRGRRTESQVDHEEVIDLTKHVAYPAPINKAYYALNKMTELRDELDTLTKKEMMQRSDQMMHAPNLGAYDKQRAYREIRSLARELIRTIDEPARPATTT